MPALSSRLSPCRLGFSLPHPFTLIHFFLSFLYLDFPLTESGVFPSLSFGIVLTFRLAVDIPERDLLFSPPVEQTVSVTVSVF